MYQIYSWRLNETEYNNLLPVMRQHLLARHFENASEYYLTGTLEQYEDAKRRCAFLD